MKHVPIGPDDAYEIFMCVAMAGRADDDAERAWIDADEGDEFLLPTGAKLRALPRWRWEIVSYAWDGMDADIDRILFS